MVYIAIQGNYAMVGQKKKVNENSLKNLIPLSERSQSERREIAKKGAEATNRIKAEKVKRAEANEYIWEALGEKTVKEVLETGTLAQKIDLIKAILPKDAQNQIISGALDIQKIFITQKEQAETDEHIENFINEG